MQTEPLAKLLMAGGSVNTAVYAGRNYTFGTLPPGYLYVDAAFRTLTNFAAPRVAVLRDVTDPICSEAEVARAAALHPEVLLHGYFELDPAAPDYQDQIRSILEDLKAQGVESLLGCSYMDLCIQVVRDTD